MTVSRVFLPGHREVGDRCELTGDDRQYVATVLRMKQGERLLLFDGAGCEYEALILGQDLRCVNLEITKKEMMHRNAISVTLAQSLPKAKKMDRIIEKACELGAESIIPFLSARSIPQIDADKAAAKQVRWQKIALEAARQSHAAGIPEIRGIISFDMMLQSAGSDANKIIFWEEERKTSLKKYLQGRREAAARNFFLVVGPEGGFDRKEIELAESRGFTSVSLGRQVLKVETAAVAILSIIHYEAGLFDPASEGGSTP